MLGRVGLIHRYSEGDVDWTPCPSCGEPASNGRVCDECKRARLVVGEYVITAKQLKDWGIEQTALDIMALINQGRPPRDG
jgi:hypothetical protein